MKEIIPQIYNKQLPQFINNLYHHCQYKIATSHHPNVMLATLPSHIVKLNEMYIIVQSVGYLWPVLVQT